MSKILAVFIFWIAGLVSVTASENSYLEASFKAIYLGNFADLEQASLKFVDEAGSLGEINPAELSALATYSYYLPIYHSSLKPEHEPLLKFLNSASGENKEAGAAIMGLLFLNYDLPEELDKDDVKAEDVFFQFVQHQNLFGITPQGHAILSVDIADQLIEKNDYTSAELRLLSSLHALDGKHTPAWDAALILSQLAMIYSETGRVYLASKVTNSVLKDIFPILSEGHLHQNRVLGTLLMVANETGNNDARERVLEILFQTNFSEGYHSLAEKYWLTEILITDAYLHSSTVDGLDTKFNVISSLINETEVERSKDLKTFFRDFLSLRDNFCEHPELRIPEFLHQSKEVLIMLDAIKVGHSLRCSDSPDFEKASGSIQEANAKILKMKKVFFNSLSRGVEPTHSLKIVREIYLGLAMLWFEKHSNQSVFHKLVSWAQGNEQQKEFVSSLITILGGTAQSLAEKELEMRQKAIASGDSSLFIDVERTLIRLREREEYITHFLDIYTQNVVNFYKGKQGSALPPNVKPFEYSLLDASKRFEELFVVDPAANLIDEIQTQLKSDQGAIFSFSGVSVKLTCIIKKTQWFCMAAPHDPSSIQNYQLEFQATLLRKQIGKNAADHGTAGKIIFPPEILALTNDLKHVFFVPENQFWSMPLQYLWLKSGALPALILSPTINSLKQPYVSTTEFEPTFQYVGIGNPNYSMDSYDISSAIGEIPGLAIRSADYVNDLTKLRQLPRTEDEILDSSNFFSGDKLLLLRKDASEENLHNEQWNSSNVIHFATHALISGEMLGLDEPSIVLSSPTKAGKQDGILTSSEISRYSFPDSLIILSACRTISDFGAPVERGMSGLSLAFLSSGAKSLLVTQWQVPDDTSKDLIKRFFFERSSGLDTPAALAKVTTDLLQTELDPYYWSAYVTISFPSRLNHSSGALLKKIALRKEEGFQPYIGSYSNNILALSYSQTKADGGLRVYTDFIEMTEETYPLKWLFRKEGRFQFLPYNSPFLESMGDQNNLPIYELWRFDFGDNTLELVNNISKKHLKKDEIIMQQSPVYELEDSKWKVLVTASEEGKTSTYLVKLDRSGRTIEISNISNDVLPTTVQTLTHPNYAYFVWGDNQTVLLSQMILNEVSSEFEPRTQEYRPRTRLDNAHLALYKIDNLSSKVTRTHFFSEMIMLGNIRKNDDNLQLLSSPLKKELYLLENGKLSLLGRAEKVSISRLIPDKNLLATTNMYSASKQRDYQKAKRLKFSLSSIAGSTQKVDPNLTISSSNNVERLEDYLLAVNEVGRDEPENVGLMMRSKVFVFLEDVFSANGREFFLFSDEEKFFVSEME